MPFCPYCGREISPIAAACPNCGHPNPLRAPTGPVFAGFWLRAASYIIDAIILAVPGAILPYLLRLPPVIRSTIRPISLGGGVTTLRDVHFSLGALGAREALGLALGFTYSWLFLALNDGRTPGALATGIRVARPDRSPVSAGTAAARQGMAIVSRVVLFLGFFWVAWDSEKRAWHDMVAGTRVFRQQKASGT